MPNSLIDQPGLLIPVVQPPMAEGIYINDRELL
jgi:hypothetical protein